MAYGAQSASHSRREEERGVQWWRHTLGGRMPSLVKRSLCVIGSTMASTYATRAAHLTTLHARVLLNEADAPRCCGWRSAAGGSRASDRVQSRVFCLRAFLPSQACSGTPEQPPSSRICIYITHPRGPPIVRAGTGAVRMSVCGYRSGYRYGYRYGSLCGSMGARQLLDLLLQAANVTVVLSGFLVHLHRFHSAVVLGRQHVQDEVAAQQGGRRKGRHRRSGLATGCYGAPCRRR